MREEENLYRVGGSCKGGGSCVGRAAIQGEGRQLYREGGSCSGRAAVQGGKRL